MNRNPWTGISAWREFKYDLRHPVQFHRRAWEGAMGRNPHVSQEQRVLGLAFVACGLLQALAGIAFIVVAVLH